MVPDTNITDTTTYAFKRGHVYKESNVVLSRSCSIGTCVVLGSGTVVGENSSIRNSVIGRNCRIGDNVKIEGSYIWDNCVIESNCSLERSILAYGVILKSHVQVSKGCVLDQQVVIGSEVRLPPFSKISRMPQGPSDDSQDESADYGDISVFDINAYDSEIVGAEGQGFLWKDNFNSESTDDEIDDDEMDSAIVEEKLEASRLASSYNDEKYTILSQYAVVDEEEDETCDEFSEHEDQDGVDLHGFKTLVSELVKNSIAANHSIVDTLTEVNAIKMSTDAKHRALTITNHDCLLAVVPAICSFIKEGDLQRSTAIVLNGWHGLISR